MADEPAAVVLGGGNLLTQKDTARRLADLSTLLAECLYSRNMRQGVYFYSLGYITRKRGL